MSGVWAATQASYCCVAVWISIPPPCGDCGSETPFRQMRERRARSAGFGGGEVALELYCALDGGEGTGKLGDYAVAGGAADAAAMLCHERVGDGAVRREDRERSLLIDAH